MRGALNQYDEALFACSKYLEFQENTLLLDHIDIVSNYQCLNTQLEHLPKTCFETINTLKLLGEIYKALQHYEQSITIFYECLEYQLNVLPSDHMDILKTYETIALMCYKSKRYEEALKNLEMTL